MEAEKRRLEEARAKMSAKKLQRLKKVCNHSSFRTGEIAHTLSEAHGKDKEDQWLNVGARIHQLGVSSNEQPTNGRPECLATQEDTANSYRGQR